MSAPEEFRSRLRKTTIARRGLATKYENSVTRANHCGCLNPVPTNTGLMLRIFGTVECSVCHRAMFTSTGKPVRS